MSHDESHNLVRHILARYEAGDVPLAEQASWRYLESHPARAEVWNLLARIALDVGRPHHGALFARRAIEVDPYFKPARKNLQLAEKAGPGGPALPAGARLVIREWRQGFFSDLDHVVGGLLLARACGRAPSVHWGNASRFSPGSGNAWTLFFEPLGEEAELPRDPSRVFPARWAGGDEARASMSLACAERAHGLAILGRREEVCVADHHVSPAWARHWLAPDDPWRGLDTVALIRAAHREWIRPRAEVVEEGEAFYRERLAGGRTLAVHARGSDKSIESPDAAGLADRLLELVRGEVEGGVERVFLLTDSLESVERFYAALGDRLVLAPATRTDRSVGLHMQGLPDPARLGREVLRDVLVAARCDAFLGLGWSNVACAVRNLRDWEEGSCRLLGPVVQERASLALVDPSVRWGS